MHTYLPTYLPINRTTDYPLPACLSTYPPTHPPTYLPTSFLPYISAQGMQREEPEAMDSDAPVSEDVESQMEDGDETVRLSSQALQSKY